MLSFCASKVANLAAPWETTGGDFELMVSTFPRDGLEMYDKPSSSSLAAAEHHGRGDFGCCYFLPGTLLMLL